MEKITLEQRFARALMIGGAGGAVACALVAQEPALHGEWGVVRCALGGAFLAGLMLARGFGGRGAWRWFRAALFFSMATVLGAVLAVFLLPVDNMLGALDLWQAVGLSAFKPFTGPAFVWAALGNGGLIVACWLAGLGAAGLTVAKQRVVQNA